jgi:hypothetical protein
MHSIVVKKQNHYEILGLWRDASEAEIRRAYRHLAMRHHPDVNSDPEAEARFRAVNEAYDVLSRPAKRAAYDATLGAGVSASTQTGTARDPGVSSGWTAPWVRDLRQAEVWLRSNAEPAPWSMRALRGEARRSWKTLTGYLALLAAVIGVCALLDWAIPWLGVVVVSAVFGLSFFAYLYYLLLWLRGEEPSVSVRRTRR